MSESRLGVLPLLLRRNGTLILAFTAAGLLQWAFLKLVALAQDATEFGRFVAILHLALILSTPLVSLQGGVSRQVAAFVAEGRREAIRPWLRGRLYAWAPPLGALIGLLVIAAGPLAGSLDLGEPWSIAILVAILVVFLPFHALLGAFAGSERVGILAGLLVLDTSGRCLLALTLPDVIATTTGALGVSLAALTLATATGWLVLGKTEPESGDAPRVPSVLPSFLAGALLLSILTYEDVLLVRRVLDPVAAGQYAAAVTIGRLILVLVYPMIPVMVPVVTRLAAENRPVRRVLVFHLVLAAGPGTAAVILGTLLPDLVGTVFLDPRKHAGLGVLVPLAFASATLLSLTNLTMHFLLSLRRRAVIPLLGVAAALAAALVLSAPPAPELILVRLVLLALGVFTVTCVLSAFARPQASR
jgi:O-antigen/teichoic acid export membrane protein